MQQKAMMSLAVAACLACYATAEVRKEYHFAVTPKANVSVTTQSGSISVKPGPSNQVTVVAILSSDKVEVDKTQKGNRLEIETHLLNGADAQTGRVDYELTVPPDASLNLHSSTGPLRAEKMHGDLTLEGADAPVEVRATSNGHVHIRTMSGMVTLSDVRSAHVEITSIKGDVHLNGVDGPLVQVNSGSGKIFYDGDFGAGGDYNFSTHTGDIEALVASTASADFNVHSVKGSVQSDVPVQPKEHPRSTFEAGRSFLGTVGKAASEVVMKSFSGKIRLKQH